MVYSKWCILNGVFSVPSPCHFTFWGISLSSTEIPGVFNPGYSQRGILCGVFLQKFAQCAMIGLENNGAGGEVGALPSARLVGDR